MKIKKITYSFILILMLIFNSIAASANTNYPYYIKVNRTTNCVTIYEKDSSGNYTVPIKAMICSVGAGNNTPVGVFKTPVKYRWRQLLGGVWGQYSTRIVGGVLFHSCCYSRQSEDTLIEKTYNRLGTKDSLGCIRLTVADAKWIYDNCPLGTSVEIFDAATDPLPRPEAVKLTKNSTYPKWDPTDPHPNNPWKNEFTKIIADQYVEYVKLGDQYVYNNMDEFLREGVTAYDTANNIIKYDISCNVNVNKVGEYDVKYYATDCLGSYGEIHRTIVVQP